MDRRLRALQRRATESPTYEHINRYIHGIFKSGNDAYLLEALHLGTPSVFLSDGSLLVRNRNQLWIVRPDWSLHRLNSYVMSLMGGRDAFRHLYPHYGAGPTQEDPRYCYYCSERIHAAEGVEWWGWFYYLAHPVGEAPVPLHGELIQPPQLFQQQINTPPELLEYDLRGCLRLYCEEYAKRDLSQQEQQNIIDQYIERLLAAIPYHPACFEPVDTAAAIAWFTRNVGSYVTARIQPPTPFEIVTALLNSQTNYLTRIINELNVESARYLYDVHAGKAGPVLWAKDEKGKRTYQPIPQIFERSGMTSASGSSPIKRNYMGRLSGEAGWHLSRELCYDFLTLSIGSYSTTIPVGGIDTPLNRVWLSDLRTAEIEQPEVMLPEKHWGGGLFRISWPFSSAVSELIAEIESIDPDPEQVDKAMLVIGAAAQQMISQYADDNYEEDEFTALDLEIQNIRIERDYEQEGQHGRVYCRPCFQIIVEAPLTTLYSDSEEISKDLHEWGIARWECWALVVADKIDLTQFKYWHTN
jgi:hypothetical protein